MSRTAGSGWDHRGFAAPERAVQRYLADKARTSPVFVKSHRVAEDLEYSAKRIGQAIAKLRQESSTLDIEAWGTPSNGQTWRVENAGPTPFGRDCDGCGWLVPESADHCPHCGTEVGR